MIHVMKATIVISVTKPVRLRHYIPDGRNKHFHDQKNTKFIAPTLYLFPIRLFRLMLRADE